MATITPNTTASGAADLTPEIEYDCLVAWSRSVFGANQHDTVHPMYLTAFKSGYKAALAASPNTTASGAADDSLLLCALDLHHSAIYDNPHEMVDCVRAVADRITALAAPAPPKLFLNGFQLRAALDFIAPDGDDEQLESEVCIQHGPERTHDEGTEAAGMYCWLSDYPEEGSIRLDDEATPEAAPVAPAPQPAPINPRTQYLTVVYRGVEAGDEARVICDHPKVSAVSWSHALDDRDAALAAAPKAAPAPVSKSFDEWLEKQFEFRNYYFDLRGPGLMAIPFARRAYEAGRAPVAEDAIALLFEVAHYFTGNDDLPNDLLPRIDALLDAQAAQPEGAKP